ncbi:hypothetical protein AAMO2058_000414300 [Amorphochlora amoebiformis]
MIRLPFRRISLSSLSLDATPCARAPARTLSTRVAIIGAGFSGLSMGIELKKRGVEDFTIFESEAKLGGTWFKNTYPGVACDTPAPVYSLESTQYPWKSQRPQGSEIRAYLEWTAEQYGIRDKIRLNTDLDRACWDAERMKWDTKFRGKEGPMAKQATESEDFDMLVSCVGQLNVPKKPNLPGLPDFQGPCFHTAEWDHSVKIQGLRVGMIGAGPSAIQAAEPLSRMVGNLTMFQRSVPYIVREQYRDFSEQEIKEYEADPSELEAMRKEQYDAAEEMYPAFYVGEDQLKWQNKLIHQMKEGLPSRLHQKCIPEYPFGIKRLGLSPAVGENSCLYYEALKRPNVSVQRSEIQRIEPNGVRLSDGKKRCSLTLTLILRLGSFHELDVLVLATGFQSTDFLNTVEITGSHGKTLQEAWEGVPQAFYGMAVPKFPNFYMIYGPGTNLGQNTVLVNIESSSRYIAQCAEMLQTGKAKALEIRDKAFLDYLKEYRSLIEKTTWSVEGVSNWYKSGKDGIVVNQSPWSVTEYRRRTTKLNPSDYIISRSPRPSDSNVLTCNSQSTNVQ